MSNCRILVGSLVLVLTLSFVKRPASAQTPGEEKRIDSLIARMTLVEKLGQLNQIHGSAYADKPDRLSPEQTAMVRRGEVGSFLGITGADETARIQRIAQGETRLGIPVLFGADIIHGYRTIFPIPLAQAASWNPELVEGAARIAAVEGSAAGVHWTYAPMVDIARDPRWGRIAEGAGEDPHLGSTMAAAQVRGFQGNNLRGPGSLLACPKHFAAYGAAEGGRDYNTVDVSERTLREVYLPPFKAAIDAGALTIMSAFNEISGRPSSGNSWLLTDLLRGEWGFRGLVVSDFESVRELMNHGVAETRSDAAVMGLTAGVDIDMVSRVYLDDLPEAIRSRRISMTEVDEAVRRVLRVKFAAGLFEGRAKVSNSALEREAFSKPEHRGHARRIARESIVLLKNDRSLLPLSKNATIALIGPLAGNENWRDLAGAWAWPEKPEQIVSIIDGIRAKLAPGTELLYDKGCELESDSGLAIQRAVAAAEKSEVVVAVLGESRLESGEAASKTDLRLHASQRALLEALISTNKPVVLVLMSGRPLILAWETAHVPAILEAWHPGTEAGNAVADVLFGDVNPSGKLPVTFPRSVGQIPLTYNSKPTGRPFNEKDSYTTRYLDSPNSPIYPFGFGLSYTSFSYSNLRILPGSIQKKQSVGILVDVTNTGKREGQEVVQVYVHDKVASMTRPVKELKAFGKIGLQPGERRTVEFRIAPLDLGFYDSRMQRTTEPGVFDVCVGGNSVEGLQSSFRLE